MKNAKLSIFLLLLVVCSIFVYYATNNPVARCLDSKKMSKPKDVQRPRYAQLYTSANKNAHLHKAIMTLNLERAEELIESGADVNERDANGCTPLHYATDVDTVSFLLNKGANINSRDNKGDTVLHYLGTFGRDIDAGVINFLVEHGADVNAKAADCDSPLHHAVLTENLDILRSLVSAGCEINPTNILGKTPLFIALTVRGMEKRQEVAKFLTEHGAKLSTKEEICYSAMSGDLERIKALQKTDRSLLFGSSVFSPLRYAIEGCQSKIVEYLLQEGADVNVKGPGDETPLHLAASNGDKEIVEMLIKAKANVNCRDKHGITPLGMAEDETIKQILLKATEVKDKSLQVSDRERKQGCPKVPDL